MDQPVYKGKITFINYEKQFATIEYLHNNKLKTVNCKTNIMAGGKKSQPCRLGDGVSFQLVLSDRGDKMTATNVTILYNTAIDLLIQKAAFENRFSGYLKKVEDKYFVKEWESYILFPIQLSPWEKPPVESAANEAISFKLINLDKPGSIMAELFSHNYLPEYKMAQEHFKNNTPVEGVVVKISPHAVYLNLFSEKIQAKLLKSDEENEQLKLGDRIRVLITHLTGTRIVIRRLISN